MFGKSCDMDIELQVNDVDAVKVPFVAKGMVFQAWAHKIMNAIKIAMAGTYDWWCLVGLLILYS